ncbi:MAG TPA: PEP-CTERM sorting domain-containing protein [Steroidobacteraceae bacterium]
MTLAAIAAVLPATAGAAPIVLDFDAAAPDWIKLEFGGFSFIDAPLHEDGFVITTLGNGNDQLGAGDHTWCADSCADNGTQALRSSAAGTVTLFQREDQSVFHFLGFDAAELGRAFLDLAATGIRVTGYRADMSSITQDFTLDLLNDGPGGIADFQTFLANGLFTNLVSLTMEGLGTNGFNYYSIDNVVLSTDPIAVPEPTGLALLLGGLGAITWMRRRARSVAG